MKGSNIDKLCVCVWGRRQGIIWAMGKHGEQQGIIDCTYLFRIQLVLIAAKSSHCHGRSGANWRNGHDKTDRIENVCKLMI